MDENYLLLKNDLAGSKNGGRIVFATDDFFAVAENLIKSDEPEWREKEYTLFGKWMDGWETRRKRKVGHDFCIIELAVEASIELIDIDTAYFTGNHAPAVSVQASVSLTPEGEAKKFERRSVLGSEATDDQISLARYSEDWSTILSDVPLKPGYPETRHNRFLIDGRPIAKYLRLNLFPDGGVARLRVYGKPVVSVHKNRVTDVAEFLRGGECVAFSNAHFGQPKNLIVPGQSAGMHDGWETARQKNRPKILGRFPDGSIKYAGSEWVLIKLAHLSAIVEIIVDTHHFKGNYPDSVRIEGAISHEENTNWDTIVPFSPGDTRHEFLVTKTAKYNFIRVTIVPDGGISRIRVLGSG